MLVMLGQGLGLGPGLENIGSGYKQHKHTIDFQKGNTQFNCSQCCTT